MCAPVALGLMGVSALMSARGAAQQSFANQAAYRYQAAAAQAEGNYQAAVERNRATIAEYQAKDAIARGAKEQNALQLKKAQLMGTQRARLAAAGLDLNEGTAFNILQDTEYMAKVDELTIQDNASKEAWVLRESAKIGMSNSEFLRAQGSNNARMLNARAGMEDPYGTFGMSLLGGATQVASAWYGMKSVGAIR